MTRFFSFGCSFTQNKWPSWADILGSQFDYDENWGKLGAGNHFIFNSLIECHLKNHIGDQDIVGIMWTNVSRLDSYKNRKWHTPGNIYTQPYYSAEIVELLADTRGFYIRDLAFIYMAQQLLEKIGCRYYMFSMVDITNHLQYDQNDAHFQISDILPYYQSTLDKIRPSVHQVVFNYDWYSRPFQMETQLSKLKDHYQSLAGPDWPPFEKVCEDHGLQGIDRRTIKEIFNLNKWNWREMIRTHRRSDPHPTPLEHLEYLSKVLPEHPISYETWQVTKQVDDLIRNDQPIDPGLMKQIKRSTIQERW